MLLVFDAKRFQTIATQFQTREFQCRTYAQAFIKNLNALDPSVLTDLGDPCFKVEEICETIFEFQRVRMQRTGSKAFRRQTSKMNMNGRNSCGNLQPADMSV